MADAGLDEVVLAAQAGGGVAELAAEVPQGRAAAVAELDVLEVAPDALVRVELGCVGGEPLQPDARGAAGGQEVGDRSAAVGRRAVPDHPAAGPAGGGAGA